MTVTGFEPSIFQLQVQRATAEPSIPAAETTANLCYLCTNLYLMYIVASSDPDPREGGQLPNPNACNSTLTSATREEMLTPGANP